jgi:gamma-glutamyltranspeptidase/glutathione hydrolase
MFTTRPEITGTFGVVASTHWLASAAGMAILERGGNAFDAAVAAGLTLQVVEPHLNGPAGEVPILFRRAEEDRMRAICGQGVSPAAATIEAFQALDLDIVPGTGLLPATVPGAFDAWMMMLHDHGTMRLADVLAFAIDYAHNGYPLVARIPAAIETVKGLFETEWPSSAAIYLKNGVPATGSLFENRDLAAMYARLLREAEAAASSRDGQIEAARRIWREGFIAETIDRFCRETEVLDTSGRRHRGLLTGADMAAWRASYEEPLTYDYHGYTVAKMGPWSQGPVFLQTLAILKEYDLAAMALDGPDFVHVVVEAMKLAFADREAFYGDPAFEPVPMEALLSDTYAAQRRRLIGAEASHELRPGTVSGHGGHIPSQAIGRAGIAAAELLSAANLMGAGEPTIQRTGATKGDTCHVDVVDKWGNMVSATPSGGWLQSSPVVPGLGFALPTRGQMFWLDTASPSALKPGKRPRTTLTPGMAMKDGKPYMAFGTPGGDQQDQWQLVFFLRHVHHGMNIQESIDAPMFHTEHFPSSFYPRGSRPGTVVVEGRLPEATVDQLRRRGHVVEVGEPWSLGRISAATKVGRTLKAGANPRGMQGYAVGR